MHDGDGLLEFPFCWCGYLGSGGRKRKRKENVYIYLSAIYHHYFKPENKLLFELNMVKIRKY